MKNGMAWKLALVAGLAGLCSAAHGQVVEANGSVVSTLVGGNEGMERYNYGASVVGTVADMPMGGLSAGTVMMLELPDMVKAFNLVVPVGGKEVLTLKLQPWDIRADEYKFATIAEDGQGHRTVTEMPRSIAKTFTGTVEEIEGAIVGASLLEEGLVATIYLPDGTQRYIQPVKDFDATAARQMHVMYVSGDSHCVGECATTDAMRIDQQVHGWGQRASCGGQNCVANIAVDADFDYYVSRGSSYFNTEDRMNALINLINHQYIRDVQIYHRITYATVRTTAANPYTSTNSDTLLNQFRNEWNANFQTVGRDTAHLFSGKDFDGSIIGLAYVGVFCGSVSNGFAYGITQSNFSTLGCQTDLISHEIGHNWSANHCTCSGSTMNAFITCTNNFTAAGSNSVAEINGHAATRACLDAGAVPPANNFIANATRMYNNGTYTGTNVGASTEGATLNCGGRGGGEFDVFWKFYAPAAGPCTITTCGSAFDTILSVHTGNPADPESVVTCNDDGGTCGGNTSSVTFNTVRNQLYYVRVAGYRGTSSGFGGNGNITLVLNATAPSPSVCGDAPLMTIGSTVSGSLFNSANDGTASCGTSATNPDVWYKVVAPCDGALTVSSCGSRNVAGTDTGADTVVSVYDTCYGTELGCSDDAFASGCSSIDSSVTVPNAVGGTTYYVRVAAFGNPVSDFRLGNANFALTASFAPAAAPSSIPTFVSPASAVVQVGAGWNMSVPSYYNATYNWYQDGVYQGSGNSFGYTFALEIDEGSWQCQVVTPCWTVLSDAVFLTVNDGPICNDLDFNNDGNIEPLDVDAYFSILGEGPCLGDVGFGCDSLDFNNDGNIEPEDVDAYFSVLGEGPCINN